jgi:hypothetical protein
VKQAGKVYSITNIQDLWDNHKDLHCIYLSAEEPLRAPEGPMVGDVLSFSNTRFLNPMLRFLWKGKFVTKIECKGEPTLLGWNKVAFGPLGPFSMTVGRIQDILPNIDKVFLDNKTSVLLDYTMEFADICPDFEAFRERNPEVMKIKASPFHKKFFPFDVIVDSMRPVGKQNDGGIIYLGEVFGRDPFRSDLRAFPLVFFCVVSYDEGAVPQMKPGQSLQPLVRIMWKNTGL